MAHVGNQHPREMEGEAAGDHDQHLSLLRGDVRSRSICWCRRNVTDRERQVEVVRPVLGPSEATLVISGCAVCFGLFRRTDFAGGSYSRDISGGTAGNRVWPRHSASSPPASPAPASSPSPTPPTTSTPSAPISSSTPSARSSPRPRPPASLQPDPDGHENYLRECSDPRTASSRLRRLDCASLKGGTTESACRQPTSPSTALAAGTTAQRRRRARRRR